MADFPATKKTFSQIVDGTTYMEAVNVNTAYNEVEAMQTFTGQLGSGNTQGYSAALLALLSGYQRAVGIVYKDAATITAAAGAIVFEAAGKYRMRVNTTTTDVDWTDIDTGAEDDDTYYVYAVADAEATTFTFMISLNATTPTGATYYKRLGTFVNATDITEASVLSDTDTHDRIVNIYDYGTSASTGTKKTARDVKIYYGSVSVTNNSSQAITNLLFALTTSYKVTLSINDTGAPSQEMRYVRDSAAQFTIHNGSGATYIVSWIAIGV